MEFCSKCGSYMKQVRDYLLCPKCWNVIRSDTGIKREPKQRSVKSDSIHVVNHSQEDLLKVSQICPECGNIEAFRWFSGISGEHAGIRRERTIEHFRCTKCSHSWSKSS